MMNAGESVPNAFLMREKRIDENSAKAVPSCSLLCKNRFLSRSPCHTRAMVAKHNTVDVTGCTLFLVSAD